MWGLVTVSIRVCWAGQCFSCKINRGNEKIKKLEANPQPSFIFGSALKSTVKLVAPWCVGVGDKLLGAQVGRGKQARIVLSCGLLAARLSRMCWTALLTISIRHDASNQASAL